MSAVTPEADISWPRCYVRLVPGPEQAADPVVEKMHQICASLPAEPTTPPNFLAMLQVQTKQLAAQAEFLQVIAQPVRALYDALSTDQRAILDRPPMPPAR